MSQKWPHHDINDDLTFERIEILPPRRVSCGAPPTLSSGSAPSPPPKPAPKYRRRGRVWSPYRSDFPRYLPSGKLPRGKCAAEGTGRTGIQDPPLTPPFPHKPTRGLCGRPWWSPWNRHPHALGWGNEGSRWPQIPRLGHLGQF